MNIGIIGAGYIGRALAKLAADHGDTVMISNSRGPHTLTSTASATHSTAGTIEDTAAFGDIVVIAIPFNARHQLPAAALAGKVVIDANNYYPQRDGAIEELDRHRTTTTGMVSVLLPQARVIKAFNAILAVDLESSGRPQGTPGRRALPVAGDDAEAKRVVAEFQDRIGFDVVDAGSLAESWRFERAKPGYCVPLDRSGMMAALAAAQRDVELPDGSWRAKAPGQAAIKPGDRPDPRTAGSRKAYANARSGQIHYAEAGTGQPLLLMGETPRSHRFFHRLMPLLAPHVRAIAVDLPGLGNSHPLPEPMSIAAIAGCLAGFLDALGLERVDVFGMHTGDKVAAALAADWPDRVDRLILAGQTHSLFPEMAGRNDALAPSFQRYHAQADNGAEGGTGGDARAMREWLGAKLTLDATWWPSKTVSGEQPDPQPLELAEAKSIDYLLGWRSCVPIYRAVFAQDFAETVGRIRAETLVLELLTEEERHYGPQAGRLAKLMPRATTQSIEVTYLAAMEDQADQVAGAILAFLKVA